MGKIPSRIPNYSSGGGNPTEHANSEATLQGTADTTWYDSHNTIASGANIVSASITITKKSCIVVVATVSIGNWSAGDPRTQIRRGGVDKTKETTISGADTYNNRVGVQYATEVLDAGTYQYDLVNSYQYAVGVYCATIKIVAVAVE